MPIHEIKSKIVYTNPTSYERICICSIIFQAQLYIFNTCYSSRFLCKFKPSKRLWFRKEKKEKEKLAHTVLFYYVLNRPIYFYKSVCSLAHDETNFSKLLTKLIIMNNGHFIFPLKPNLTF